MKSGDNKYRSNIIDAIQTPLGFFVLVVLVVEAILGGVAAFSDTFDRTFTIAGMLILLLALIGVVGFLTYSRPDALLGQRLPPQSSDGAKDRFFSNVRLTGHDLKRWSGRWNCQWTILTAKNLLVPYVDDGLVMDTINLESGFVDGAGLTAYGSGGTYKFKGKMITHSIGVFWYTSDEGAFSGLDGVFVLRMNGIGKVNGWWLGRGSDGTEIGGKVELYRYDEKEPWNFKVHPYPPPE